MESLIEFVLGLPALCVALIDDGKTYVLLIPVYTLLLGGERLVHAFTQERQWDNRDAAANLFITGVMLLKDLLVGVYLPLAIIVWLFDNANLFTLGNQWWGWLLAFLLYDLTWYTDHRIGHRVGLFWALHQVHHSSQEYNMTVASRGFILDSFATRPLFYLLPVLGVSPLQYITVQVLTNILGIAQHTRLVGRLGLLDMLFATPSNHRVHHGSDVKYLDKNYGEVLIIWDHIFGSYKREEEEPNYGLTANIDTYNPIVIEIDGIRRLWCQIKSANKISDKLKYLWKPPGWDHTGSGQTTEELQRAQPT